MRNKQKLMKKIILFLGILLSMSTIAQTYVDKPFIQDYADKFELSEELKNADLLKVRSDRDKLINIVSVDKLLQSGDKVIVENHYYRPFENMDVASMEIYKDQFVYLTGNSVLSNAWSGSTTSLSILFKASIL